MFPILCPPDEPITLVSTITFTAWQDNYESAGSNLITFIAKWTHINLNLITFLEDLRIDFGMLMHLTGFAATRTLERVSGLVPLANNVIRFEDVQGLVCYEGNKVQ